MKNLLRKMIIACFAVPAALTAATALAQSSPETVLPKIEEARIISISFNLKGAGRILAADREGKVHQYLEVWEDDKKSPNVVTYVLVGEGKTFTATWGRGPVNASAFRCKAESVPQFGEKALWVATSSDGVLTFKEIDDGDIKGLFANVIQARRNFDREVGGWNPRRMANTPENNILSLLKEKTRKKWLELGWLRPATTCVKHFS
jgi:hypothetical protein